MLAERQIVNQVESAFHPFRCVAEIWDYGQKLRFKVFDEEGVEVLELKKIILRSISDPANLHVFIENARDLVRAKQTRALTYG